MMTGLDAAVVGTTKVAMMSLPRSALAWSSPGRPCPTTSTLAPWILRPSEPLGVTARCQTTM